MIAINDREKEISLFDILEFFQESWRAIASFTLLGIAGADLWLWEVFKNYEASAKSSWRRSQTSITLTPPSERKNQ